MRAIFRGSLIFKVSPECDIKRSALFLSFLFCLVHFTYDKQHAIIQSLSDSAWYYKTLTICGINISLFHENDILMQRNFGVYDTP